MAAKKRKKLPRIDSADLPFEELPKRRRRAASIVAAGFAGATESEIAADHGVSREVVHNVATQAKAGRLQPDRAPAPLDAALPPEQAAVVGEVVGAAVSGAITWCGDVQRVGRKAVLFLEKALDGAGEDCPPLNPSNHNHVRVVGEAILRILADVMKLNWLMTTHSSEPTGLSREIESMSDTELAEEAKKALELLK